MTTTTTVASRSMINLGTLTKIPLGEGRAYLIGSRIVAVFRTRAGAVFATQGVCPHRGGPLADGIIGAGQVICPLHAYKFDLASGEPVGNDCEALATYTVSVSEGGDILITVPGEGGGRGT